MGFTAAQAARLTGCSLSQLSSWERIGLVVPPPDRMHTYSFQDLVALRVVASLLDAGLGLARIRRAVHYLVESGEGDASLALVTDGDTVWACRDDGEILDALRHGQLRSSSASTASRPTWRPRSAVRRRTSGVRGRAARRRDRRRRDRAAGYRRSGVGSSRRRQRSRRPAPARNAALTELASRHACLARSASGVTDP